MFAVKIRTSIAALAIAVGFASAMPVVSQAKPIRPGTVTTAGNHPVSTTTTSAKPVDAGSTGDGPADDRDCQGFAATINYLLDTAQDELNDHGNGADFNMLIDDAKMYQDIAEDDGCFIVNPI